MAHREEDVKAAEKPQMAEIWLMDVEPFSGLITAVARFCQSLTPEVYEALSTEGTEALSTIQGILWRLEHANVERIK
jgi:hypothetical protein